MTIAEIERAVESKHRISKSQQKEKAYFDYILANLIGLNSIRAFNSSIKIPAFYELYPDLFDNDTQKIEEVATSKQDELSALRFVQFANFYNKNFKT